MTREEELELLKTLYDEALRGARSSKPDSSAVVFVQDRTDPQAIGNYLADNVNALSDGEIYMLSAAYEYHKIAVKSP